jgi:hypothetical protein
VQPAIAVSIREQLYELSHILTGRCLCFRLVLLLRLILWMSSQQPCWLYWWFGAIFWCRYCHWRTCLTSTSRPSTAPNLELASVAWDTSGLTRCSSNMPTFEFGTRFVHHAIELRKYASVSTSLLFPLHVVFRDGVLCSIRLFLIFSGVMFFPLVNYDRFVTCKVESCCLALIAQMFLWIAWLHNLNIKFHFSEKHGTCSAPVVQDELQYFTIALTSTSSITLWFIAGSV